MWYPFFLGVTMDHKGYELVKKAFEPDIEVDWYGIEATVTPEPKPEEDYRFVTVTTRPNLPPEVILNALQRALLLSGAEQSRQLNIEDGELSKEAPELHPLAIQPGSITFEDHNRVTNSLLYY
jgi:hypothetical protein